MIADEKINKIIIILLVLALMFTCVFTYKPEWLGIEAAGANPEYLEKLFDKDKIASIEIEADEEAWKEMLDNAMNEEYIACNITINGERYEQVGIRPKGNSSLQTVVQSDSDRYSFKIKMDEYVKGQNYHGLSKFVVNNMQGDNSYMKEYLSYDMFEYLGVETPAYAFANITINGENGGLYLAVESVEEEWAQRTYGKSYGQLYKPESMDMGGKNIEKDFSKDGLPAGANMPPKFDQQKFNSENFNLENARPEGFNPEDFNFENASPEDFNPAGFNFEGLNSENVNPEDFKKSGEKMGMGDSGSGADLKYIDDDAGSYSQIFNNAVFSNVDESDKKAVIKAIKALNSGKQSEIEKYCDTQEILKYFAVNTLLVNEDSYIGQFKHNYYLYEENSKLSIIPWDLNLSFAGFSMGKDDSSAINFPIDTPVSSRISLEDRPLIGALLEFDKYKEEYHSYLSQLCEEYFESGYFENKVDTLDKMISQYVENDATAFCTYEEYQKAIIALKTFAELRVESIEGQLSGEIPSTTEEQSENPELLIDAGTLNLSDMGTQGRGMSDSRNQGNKNQVSEAPADMMRENKNLKDNDSKNTSAEKDGRQQQAHRQDGGRDSREIPRSSINGSEPPILDEGVRTTNPPNFDKFIEN